MSSSERSYLNTPGLWAIFMVVIGYILLAASLHYTNEGAVSPYHGPTCDGEPMNPGDICMGTGPGPGEYIERAEWQRENSQLSGWMLGEKVGILGTALVIIGVGWFISSRMKSDLRFSVTSMLSGATIPLIIVSFFLWPLEKNYNFEGELGIVGRMDSYFGVPSSPFMMAAFVAIGSWLVYGVVTADQWEQVEARQEQADPVPRRDGYAFMFNITYFVLFGVVAAWFFSLGGGWTALAIGVTLLLLPTSVFALDALKFKRRDIAGIPIEDSLAPFRWTKS